MTLRLTMISAALALAMPLQVVFAHSAEIDSGAKAQAARAVIAGLEGQRTSAGQSGDLGFRLEHQHPDSAEAVVYRVSHTYRGLPILGSESVILGNANGSILQQTDYDRRGQLAKPGMTVAGFDMRPNLSQEQAIAKLVKTLPPGSTHLLPPQAELAIYPITTRVRIASAQNKPESALNALDLETRVKGHLLVYQVRLRMKSGSNELATHALLSALDGEILKQWTPVYSVMGTARTQYSGTVSISTTQKDGSYWLLDTTRSTRPHPVAPDFGGLAVTNLDNGHAAPGILYDSEDNVWGDGTNSSPFGLSMTNTAKTVAADAMFGLQKTWDMLYNVLGWRGIDGNDTQSYIGVHFAYVNERGEPVAANAVYDSDCFCVKLGDGNAQLRNFATPDVVAHELFHGVNHAISKTGFGPSGAYDLGESAALNESIADIGAEMVEAMVKSGSTGSVLPNSGNDWMIGRGLLKTHDRPLRWMDKPSRDDNTSADTPGREFLHSRDEWAPDFHNLRAHFGSGPNNRMFYFLSQGSSDSPSSDHYSRFLTKNPRAMTGIGNDKAFRIWFKTVVRKFGQSTDYAAARNLVLQTATECAVKTAIATS